MEITQAYAVAIGGAFLVVLLANSRAHVRSVVHLARLLLVRLSYVRILRRMRLIGPWHLSTLIFLTAFLTINAYLTFFNGVKVVSAKETRIRAANLALINLVPVVAGPSQNFLAYIFGIRLKTFQKIHSSLALTSLILLGVHAFAALVNQRPFSLNVMGNAWALAAAIWLLAVAILALPWFRWPYEVFARIHQLSAVLLPFLIWKHLGSNANIYFHLFVASFPVALVPQMVLLGYRNIIWRSRKPVGTAKADEEAIEMEVIDGKATFVSPKAATQVTAKIVNLRNAAQERLNEESQRETGLARILKHDIVQIMLELPRPVRVREGQYIGLWTHAIGTFSALQVHPFMVTSWSEGKTDRLRLLVGPRNGWTKKLLRYSDTPWRALFTGPYGMSVPTRNYAIVLLIASGLGLIAQIPYLKQLIHDHNARRTRARRIHLVWQLKTPDLGFIFENILNEALDEDTLDDGKILSISIYIESGSSNQVEFSQRAVVYSGIANLSTIIESERTGDNIIRVQEEEEKKEDMLVLVSGAKDVRDDLRRIARTYVYEKVSLVELEYQPDSSL